MMRRIHILHILLPAMVVLMSVHSVWAQQAIVRYVDPRPYERALHDASYYDGTSWEKAMPNLQDAINNVQSSMDWAGYYTAEGALKAGYQPGIVYVAGAECTRNTEVPATSPYYNTFFNSDDTYHGGIIYKPTESTERDKDGVLYTSFKMYAGVHVYGGYHGDVYDGGGNLILAGETGNDLRPENRVRDWQWNYKYKTILSGNHGGRATTFTWNNTKNMFDAVYPGNSYHVVWFATNGFGEGVNNRARALPSESILNGCVIQDGRAGNRSLTDTDYSTCHTAYGGGAYLVTNAVISNCIFLHNGAVRAGGAAYLDGGGLIDHCMVQKCQSEGNGIGSGLGGGICLADDGMVRHSFIANCYANMGGGVALMHDENCLHDDDHDALVVGSLVTNNNAGTEAGGIYMYRGGILNQVTVTLNRLTGPATIVNGVAYGRSAGVFVDRDARILNTVMWGGHVRSLENTKSSEDLQFAANTVYSTIQLRPNVQYSALSYNEITDWNGCVRTSVLSLSADNAGDDISGATLYPNLIHVPLQLKDGVTSDFDNVNNYEPYVGVCRTTMKLNHQLYGYTSDKGEDVDNSNFHYGTAQVNEVHAAKHYGDGILFPNHASALRARGVRVEDLTSEPLMLNAVVDVDAKNQVIQPRTTLGAICAVEVSAIPVLVNSVETAEGYTSENEGLLPTLFVDPNYHGVSADAVVGESWEAPLVNINDALVYMDRYLQDNPMYQRGQVLVKQGTLDISGQTSIGGRLRECFVLIRSNTRVYGGYPSTNTGTSIENRSPRKYETHLTGNLIDYKSDEDRNYDYNATHIVSMSGSENATLDGFHIMYGNATWINSVIEDGDMPRYRIANSRGGGLIVSDEQVSLDFVQQIMSDPNRLTHVRHNVVRNCVFANNTATNGSAVYINVRHHKVHFDFVNCAFRNNTATVPEAYPAGPKSYYDAEQETYAGYNGCETGYDSPCTVFLSSQYAEGNQVESALEATFDHCDFVKNVGYAIGISGLPGTTVHTPANTDFSAGSPQLLALQKNDNISVKITNSILWANAITPKADSEVLANYESDGKDVRTWYARGIDRDAVRRENGEFGAIFGIDNISSPEAQAVMLDRWMNGYEDTEGHTPFTGYAMLTYRDESNLGTYTFPIFQNPTKNIGASHGKQNTKYGGACSYMPRNMNPIVNAAINSTQLYDYGRVSRAYGGAADIGYIENTEQPLTGTVYYVRDYTANGTNTATYDKDAHDNLTENASGLGIYNQFGQLLDGSTWARAVNGNAIYPDSKVGLQHAVDEASEAWISGSNKQVWVAAGLYQHDNTTKDKNGDNSCFIIRDHVNVYGAFPKVGNPSTTERHPLLSQYIYKPDNITARIEDYETILEPLTKTVTKNSANRVLGQQYANNPHKPGYSDYDGCEWDGFTLRHGVLDVKMINDNVGNGGSGLAIYKNVIARNMVITENTEFFDGEFRGGAVYIGGGTAENLYIINNEMYGWDYTRNERKNTVAVGYGGGAYLRHNCTMYNCLVYGNEITCNYSDGAGLFLDGTATFFNNTIVSNSATGNTSSIGGLATWTSGTTSQLNLYNCIIHSNIGKNGSSIGTKDIGIRQKGVINVINSLVEAGTNAGSGDKKIVYESSVQREADATNIFANVVVGDFLHSNYRLKADINNKAINQGEDSPVVDGITYDLSSYTDMDYADRIQDCRIDIGAYEFNGAYLIEPTLRNDTAFYYVTENGRGLSSGADPANAACWQKLQKILDAAGRYLYDNPTKKIVVKIAGDAGHSGFKYLPTRNAGENELEQENPRFYSYMIPHGVELWGGYSDVYNGPTDHGFLDTNRSITGNPSYIRGWHEEAGEEVDSYHCLTFTNTIYDEEGLPILTLGQLDPENHPDDDSEVSLANIGRKTIVDGIFITGGKATGEDEESQRGGAAVVPGYAIIRNCIIENNEASQQGGALYLQKGAIVDGCLIKNNTAGVEGGGIAVEDYTYFDGSTTNPDMEHDYPLMPRIVGCTMVLNSAKRGGGMSFHTQTRAYAVVLWQNDANEYDNLYGVFEPQRSISQDNNFAQYPLAYCAVENVRVPGLDNISVSSRNDEGVRFKTDAATLTANGVETITYSGMDTQDVDTYFGIEDFSVLVRTGVPTTMFEEYQPIFRYRDDDFMDVPRVYEDEETHEKIDYIDIGARAVGKFMRVRPELGLIMTRLFVVPAHNIDYATVKKLQLLESSLDNTEKIYSQQGSSFAYPMQQLDDALMYIREARKLKATADGTDPQGNAYHTGEFALRNTVFEIFISGGTFYPMRNLRGEQAQSAASTFLVPEGVHIFGGLNLDDMNGPRLYRYCQETSGTKTVGTGVNEVELDPMTTTAIRLYHRRLYDLNANSIIEPWEHENQTILSGQAVNDLSASEETNSYHVVSIIAAEQYVGGLPDIGCTPITSTDPKSAGIKPTEAGKMVVLDGLLIQDGRAHSFSTELINPYGIFKGGGLYVNGSWKSEGDGSVGDPYTDVFLDNANPSEKDDHDSRKMGYRNIPVTLRACKFMNNEGGEGAAIWSNGQIEMYSCSFEANKAHAGSETINDMEHHSSITLDYEGEGGVVYTSNLLTAVNTLYANNEAEIGGVIYAGGNGSALLLNCDLVRNKATQYPCLYYDTPNFKTDVVPVNLQPWRWRPQMNISTVFWGNEASSNNLVANQWSTSSAIDEQLWFCAYEQGVGPDPIYDSDPQDWKNYRKIPFVQTEGMTIGRMFSEYEFINPADDSHVNGEADVNMNVIIASTNESDDGPNFGNPSLVAGVAGYTPSADWMPARQNNLTDNGWTYVSQTVSYNSGEHEYECHINTYDADIPAEGKKAGQVIGDGAYWAAAYNDYLPEKLIVLGEIPYMQLAQYYPGLDPDTWLLRVSKDPNPSQNQTYIDIGVYEYQHVLLKPSTYGETDILWVSTKEKPDNGIADGSDWHHPTSDVQRAIETLLASRNDHHKAIHFVEGDYTPVYTVSNNLGFLINTTHLNDAVSVPDDQQHGVLSLTFRGGFSADVESQNDPSTWVRDWEEYPSVVRSSERAGILPSVMGSLFYIADAHNIKSQRSGDTFEHKSKYAIPRVGGGTDNNSEIIPITFDGLQISNSRSTATANGSAIYYADQYKWNNKDSHHDGDYIDWEYAKGPYAEKTEFFRPDTDDPDTWSYPAKLTIKNCVFFANGTRSNQGSQGVAVSIGRGAVHGDGTADSKFSYGNADFGSPLIYNCLFHSNAGRSIDAYDTRIVNCTFALNGGGIELKNEKIDGMWSSIYTSMLWRNGTEEYTIPANHFVQHNLIYNFNEDDNDGVYAQMNHWLSHTNHDVADGPNFRNPNETFRLGITSAATKADVETMQLRNFNLMPGMKTLTVNNRVARAKIYYDQVSTDVNNTLASADGLGAKPDWNVAWTELTAPDMLFNDYDLSGPMNIDIITNGYSRYRGKAIEYGAYEYKGDLQRVIYVNPSYSTNLGTGLTWQTAMERGRLQEAINLGAVYANNNPGYEAYVFCKAATGTGNTVMPIGESVMMRPGVNIYGSIHSEFLDEVNGLTVEDFNVDYANAHSTQMIENFAELVRQRRLGLTEPTTKRTIISGIDGSNTQDKPSLIDGFEVRPETTLIDGDEVSVPITSPAVVLGPGNIGSAQLPIAIRNCLIHDFTATTGNVVEIRNGLLYNVLLRDNTLAPGNTTGYHTRVDKFGWVLNCTLDAENAARLINYGSGANVSHLHNTLYGTRTQTTFSAPHAVNNKQPYAPYFSENGYARYTFDDRRNMSYQLLETSEAINGTQLSATEANTDVTDWLTVPALTSEDVVALHRYVDYTRDLDLLGNPRVLDTQLDYGCYETWATQEGALTINNDRVAEQYVASSYGGNMYPHEGSVMYVSKPIIVESVPANKLDQRELLSRIVPGYFLLKEGTDAAGNAAGWYGSATTGTGVDRRYTGEGVTELRLAYAAVERTFQQPNNLVSLPFDYNYTQVPDADAYWYDGQLRAEWNYRFVAPSADGSESPCWHTATGLVPANQGVYLHLNDEITSPGKTQRFTSLTSVANEYIYTERDGKTVDLYQYDAGKQSDIQSNGHPHFTSKENMGWNLVGQPYMVSNYMTEENTQVENYWTDAYLALQPYQMHKPHEMILFKTEEGVDSQYAAIYQSWLDGAQLGAATGFFTQTSITEWNADRMDGYRPVEELHFGLPKLKVAPMPAPVRQESLDDWWGGAHDPVAEQDLGPCKVTVTDGRLRYRVPEGVSSVQVYSMLGLMLYQADQSELIDIELPVGTYVLTLM
ncbi:MAG: hypothetical protein MJZ89_04910 [Paludibacteraceae bacterium]|nr:hypothetical protein [Paludibacteraceae bacterium]